MFLKTRISNKTTNWADGVWVGVRDMEECNYLQEVTTFNNTPKKKERLKQFAIIYGMKRHKFSLYFLEVQ